jgi:dTDP-4-dehydrorhamnose reductase
MKWLITGGSGQLGRTLEGYLEKSGEEVVALTRNLLDIDNYAQVKKVISGQTPEILVNCAAWTDVDGAETQMDQAVATNARAAHNLSRLAKELDFRFIHISTDFVFGADGKDLYSENDPHCPVNFYGASKAMGEALIMEENPDSVIIRASWLYSPFGKNFPKAIIRKLITDESTISVVDDQMGQPTSCKSLSKTITEIGSRLELKGIFHGSAQGSVSRHGLAQEIARLIGVNLERIQPIDSSSLNLPAKRPSKSILEHVKQAYENIELPTHWKKDLASQINLIKATVDSES